LHHTKFETEQNKASVVQHYETKITQSPKGKRKEEEKSMFWKQTDMVSVEEYRQK
jgi:hypothetical protein